MIWFESPLQVYLDDHLCNSLPTEGLASHEALALDTRYSVERRGDSQQARGRDQARCFVDETEPLDNGHDEVDEGACVVGSEPPHKCIKGRRRRADAK